MIILYCTNTLWVGGGIEHITIAKANALAAIPGNVVWMAVVDNRFPPIMPLHPAIHIVDLGLKYFHDDHKRNRIFNLMHIWRQCRLHKKKLKTVIRDIGPDIVISTDSLEKHFLPTLRTNPQQVFIREYHMCRTFHKFSANGFLERVLGGISETMGIFVAKKYDQIVVLTNEDKEQNWKTRDKVIVIPNPLTYSHSFVSTLNNKTISAAGRLCHQKNYDLLIDSWLLVHHKYPDWHLNIWGDGPDRQRLRQKINNYNLDNSVFLKGYDNQILDKLATSSIFVLSSLYEGLPLVLLEAFSCGVPAVSTACPCGPKDIITEGKNGFLVPVGDKMALADRICRLIEDPNLREQMGGSALETSKQFSMDSIIHRWMSLFEDLIAEKRAIAN